MKTWKHYIQSYGICGVSLLFLTGMPVWYMLEKDRIVSQQEQRSLQQLPTFHIEDVLNGSYQSSLQQYLQDQLPARDFLFRKKTQMEHLLGKSEFNQILIGKDDMLFQETVVADSAAIKAKGNRINAFHKRYPDIAMNVMIVANKQQIYGDQLPSFVDQIDQTAFIDSFYKQLDTSIKTVDATGVLAKHAKEELFYHSDHHWTTKAAYQCFQSYQKQCLGKTKPISYTPYTISNQFQGALAKTSGYVASLKDHVEIYLPEKGDVETIVNYVEEQKKTASIYDEEKATSANPYEVFFGGNHPRIDVTTNSQNPKSLLVIKDSFANCFVPFLLPYYHEITIIDPRYYNDDLDVLMKETNFDEILFLYNANTFFSDTAMTELLGNA